MSEVTFRKLLKLFQPNYRTCCCFSGVSGCVLAELKSQHWKRLTGFLYCQLTRWQCRWYLQKNVPAFKSFYIQAPRMLLLCRQQQTIIVNNFLLNLFWCNHLPTLNLLPCWGLSGRFVCYQSGLQYSSTPAAAEAVSTPSLSEQH